MEQRTQQQLATAARFRGLAHALAATPGAGLVTPPPLDWTLVVAFYAAVQYVGAYLWAKQRAEFQNHQTRERAIVTVPELRPAQGGYLRLRRLSENTRYTYHFRPKPAEVRDALDNDLDAVRRAVLTTLGRPL